MSRARAVEVEEESGVRSRCGERGEGDGLEVPAMRVSYGVVFWGEELGEK